jgi:FkbM family methyltransferase
VLDYQTFSKNLNFTMQHIDISHSLRLVMARHGLILVNLKDHYIGQGIAMYGEYSQLECECLLQWMPQGRDAVEIGANMGSLSLPLAKHLDKQGRRLLVVEPQPFIFQQLCANLALNHVRNTTAIPLACAPSPMPLYFSRQDYEAEGNFGAVALRSEPRPGDERIQALPLDDMLDASWDVGLLKIDVEGMEGSVLESAEKMIQRCRPVIYLENDQVAKSKALIEQLWALKYQLWFHLPAMFNANNFAGLSINHYPNTVSINMLCLPQECVSRPSEAPISDSNWHPLTAHLDSSGVERLR